jgi:hypothetical protein
MREIERHNPPLAGVLPKTYNLFTSTLLKELLKKVSEIPATLDYDAFGEFDFVLANPPLNVNAVDRERLADMVGAGRRFPFGLPRTDNANSLWIQLFYSALNSHGRAGFVMANSASDARSSEQELRRKLIEARAVDVMVAVGPQHVLHRHPALHPVVPRQGQGQDSTRRQRALYRRPATSTAKSIAPTATGRRHKSASSPTWYASIAAKRST